MRTRLVARFAALALAHVFALGAALPAAASAGCLRGNLLRSECCCHAESQSDERIERRCCCEVDAPAAPPTSRVEAAPASSRGPEVSVAALAPAPRTADTTLAPLLLRARSLALATGPPLILLKRSLLI